MADLWSSWFLFSFFGITVYAFGQWITTSIDQDVFPVAAQVPLGLTKLPPSGPQAHLTFQIVPVGRGRDYWGTSVIAEVPLDSTKWPAPHPHACPAAQIVSLGSGRGCSVTQIAQDGIHVAAWVPVSVTRWVPPVPWVDLTLQIVPTGCWLGCRGQRTSCPLMLQELRSWVYKMV